MTKARDQFFIVDLRQYSERSMINARAPARLTKVARTIEKKGTAHYVREIGWLESTQFSYKNSYEMEIRSIEKP